MDTLHSTLHALHTETKSDGDHLTVFREFLHLLDRMQRTAQTPRPQPEKPASRRKANRRGRG